MSTDALLIALAETRHRRDTADQYIRTLLAYARELSTARPYSLADLAEAAGIAASAVPTAYTTADVHRAAAMPVTPSTEQFRDYWHAIAAMRDSATDLAQPD